MRELLKEHDAVIADGYVVLILFLYYQSLTLWYSRNNHTRQHRNQLHEIAQTSNPPIRLLAWYWSTRQPPSTIHRIMSDRIIARGENHPALVGDAVTRSHEEVLWMFLNQVEGLEEDEVDEIVEMGVEDSLEELLEKVIEGCVQVLGMERPSQEKVEEALEAVREYKPKKDLIKLRGSTYFSPRWICRPSSTQFSQLGALRKARNTSSHEYRLRANAI